MFVRILWGLAIMGLGFLVVWRTGGLVDMLGRSDWAERTLGGGGTYTLYRLIGVVIVLVGIMVTAQLHQELLGFVAGLFIPGP